jgi:protease PrsW
MNGLWLAVFFHGLFDFFLFLRDNQLVQQHVSDIFLFAGAFVTFVISLFLSWRATREHIAYSREKWSGIDPEGPSSPQKNS